MLHSAVALVVVVVVDIVRQLPHSNSLNLYRAREKAKARSNEFRLDIKTTVTCSYSSTCILIIPGAALFYTQIAIVSAWILGVSGTIECWETNAAGYEGTVSYGDNTQIKTSNNY